MANLVPVYQLNATLTAALDDASILMQIDDDSYYLLETKLTGGNWTYLQIRQGSLYEIVRVTDIGSGMVEIARGQDGTTSQDFAVGATVTFVLSPSAVANIITDTQLAGLTITGEGLITVEEVSPGEWGISAEPVVITSNSTNIVVEGNHYSGYFIGARQAIGCCEDLAPEEEP